MSTHLEIVNARCPDLGPHWPDLLARSDANVFMHPAAARAAEAMKFSDTRTLLAWDKSASPARLVGIWTLSITALSGAGPETLAGLPFEYAFLSNPIVDRNLVDVVVPAFLDAIEYDRTLNRPLHLKYLDLDTPTGNALEKAIASRPRQALRLAERERPYVTRTSGQKLTGSTRKKLKQDWNRLSAAGKVEIVDDRAPQAVAEAFETFLALEARSWKGENGTALLSNPRDAAFSRRLIAGLAAEGAASVALLVLDGKAIAAQVILKCATTAYTWKTAYDADFSKFSPGALLVDQLTQRLLSSEGGFEAIESCSPDGGFMEQLWSGRRRTAELLVNLGSRRSLGYMSHAAWHRGRARLKEIRHGAGALASVLAFIGLIETP